MWSLTNQQKVFKRYHGDEHFSEFYLQDGGKINRYRYRTKLPVRHCHPMYRASGGQTGEWALVQEEQMGPLLTPEKNSLNR